MAAKDIEILKPPLNAIAGALNTSDQRLSRIEDDVDIINKKLDTALSGIKLSVKMVDSFTKLSDKFIEAPLQHKVITLALPLMLSAITTFLIVLMAVIFVGESPTEIFKMMLESITEMIKLIMKFFGYEEVSQ